MPNKTDRDPDAKTEEGGLEPYDDESDEADEERQPLFAEKDDIIETD